MSIIPFIYSSPCKNGLSRAHLFDHTQTPKDDYNRHSRDVDVLIPKMVKDLILILLKKF